MLYRERLGPLRKMSHDLPKAYDPTAIEDRWAEYWVRERLFETPTPEGAPAASPFTILLPPPNVTGRLHMGHMLNQTEMDILTRWRRMCGDVTLWLPGTDHAGIATQMMVERQLAAEGKTRQELGREAFVERVWQWKQHHGGAILGQMQRLGASVDDFSPAPPRVRRQCGATWPWPSSRTTSATSTCMASISGCRLWGARFP